MRVSGRAKDEMRAVKLTRGFTRYAEGSVLVEFGNTRVICNVSIDNGVPPFLKGQGKGWVTAEYGMLPRSTSQRMRREASLSRQGGRTLEIQRLIGRSMRAVVDLSVLGERTLIVDCDVIQADGGTRTASITGACVALVDAVNGGMASGLFASNPMTGRIASVSVGICDGAAVLDLDYAEDSTAETDMNVVMNAEGAFIEVQGTAEARAFTGAQLDEMLALARKGIGQLFEIQERALAG